MHYISGSVYTGHWVADLYEGEGTLMYSRGPHLQYQGSWAAGKRNGHGKCIYRTGEVIAEIEGNWSKNQTKGKTHIQYADGSVYGEFY
jgi:hypothetical protein